MSVPRDIPDLGCTTSIDVLRDRVALNGRVVLDVGCGGMTFSRHLAAAGARVLALEPDPAQAARNRAAPPPPGINFIQAGAGGREPLPAATGSADGICFSFSLHHVPAGEHAAALAEVRRVLAPGGFLCVVEPADGPSNELLRHLDDEDRVRAEAQASLDAHAVPSFNSRESFTYHSFIEYRSFDELLVRHAISAPPPALREAFERLAPGPPPHRFASRKLLRLFRGPRSG